MDKNDTGRRSHYLTVQFSINDAPAGNELIAALGAATSEDLTIELEIATLI